MKTKRLFFFKGGGTVGLIKAYDIEEAYQIIRTRFSDPVEIRRVPSKFEVFMPIFESDLKRGGN